MYSAVKIRRRKIKDEFLIMNVLTPKNLKYRMVLHMNTSSKRLQRSIRYRAVSTLLKYLPDGLTSLFIMLFQSSCSMTMERPDHEAIMTLYRDIGCCERRGNQTRSQKDFRVTHVTQ
jgi:hypothetical protein